MMRNGCPLLHIARRKPKPLPAPGVSPELAPHI
jgi:hypothetical protein